MSTSGGYVQQARSLMAIGRLSEAVPLLQKAIGEHPQAPLPHCLLAACYLDLGRKSEALKLTEKAIGIQPEFPMAHRLRSAALLSMGQKKPALSAAREAVRLSPSDPAALRTMAEAQLTNKQFTEAQASARRVIQLSPAEADGYVVLGRVALRQKRWKEAESHCREALRLEPQNWVAMNNLGVALQGQRRQKEAIEAYENAARLNPKAEVARSNLFAQTRRYLIPVSGLLIFVVLRIVLAAGLNPVWSLVMIGALVVAVALFILIRRRQLSHTVRTFYDLERRRRRWRNLAYLGGWGLGFILILVLGLAGLAAMQSGAIAVLMIAAVIGWRFAWPRLWRWAIVPRFFQ